MQVMTLERWVELFGHLCLYALVVYVVRLYVLQKIRDKAIDAIHKMNICYIENGIKYDPKIWEHYGFGSRMGNVLRKQLICLHKWNFDEFYPDLVRHK